MIVGSIELENYRGFRQYRISGLARVNLLVGKNNSGKTSILEAVQILAFHGDPRVLARIARQRGEVIAVGEDRDEIFPDVSHFFHGHEFLPGITFKVTGDDFLGSVAMRVASLSELDEKQQSVLDKPAIYRRGMFQRDGLSDSPEVFPILVEGSKHPHSFTAFPVSEEGAFLLEPARFPHMGNWRRDGVSHVQFITPESLDSRLMSQMWDKVITEGREAEVIQAMKILEPELGNIFFLSGERAFNFGLAGILVGFEDNKRKRVPMGSYGEGMRRLLALSLSLDRTQGGILLVDEIDTGLHYSILGDMWLLLVKAAIQYDIQIFATTHSLDCIRGLAWLCERHPELASEVSVQKIDGRLEESVALDANKIRIAVEQDLEVR